MERGFLFPFLFGGCGAGQGEKGLKISLKLAVIKGREGGREGGGSWKVPPLPLPPGPKGGHLLSLSSSSSFLPCLLVEGEEVEKRESFSAQKAAAAAKKVWGFFFAEERASSHPCSSSLSFFMIAFIPPPVLSRKVFQKPAAGRVGGSVGWLAIISRGNIS